MADRFVDGNTRAWWVTTISDITAPTVAEIDAGVDLTSYITGDGLDIAPDQASVDTTSLASTSDTNSWGRASVPTSLTMKRKTTDTAWSTFASEPAGHLVVRRGVDRTTAVAAAQKVEVYPAIASKRFPVKPAGNEVEKFMVKLGLDDAAGAYQEEATVAA